MFILRQRHFDAFANAARLSFEDEMVAHAKRISPDHTRVLGDGQVRVAVRKALGDARRRRFTNRGPARLWVELMFLFGHGFAEDPQYPWAGEILCDGCGSQTARAQLLYRATLHYNDVVRGPVDAYRRRALVCLLDEFRETNRLEDHALEATLLAQLGRGYPEKFQYVGEAGLRALLEEAFQAAELHGFLAPRERALIFVLMFTFGHECLNDPLYPWITRTLVQPHRVSPAARARRLERRTLIWLDRVLAVMAVRHDEL